MIGGCREQLLPLRAASGDFDRSTATESWFLVVQPYQQRFEIASADRPQRAAIGAYCGLSRSHAIGESKQALRVTNEASFGEFLADCEISNASGQRVLSGADLMEMIQ